MYQINLKPKDKSRRNTESNEFQLKSNLFFIYPEYGKIDGTQNFDICLIKTSANEFGIHEDLSSKFDTIPCLPKTIDLSKVRSTSTIIFKKNRFQNPFSGAW